MNIVNLESETIYVLSSARVFQKPSETQGA